MKEFSMMTAIFQVGAIVFTCALFYIVYLLIKKLRK
ncbi:hypothetical protein DFP93_10611 [Aneurinibacillus soli]|uniref:Uncharacterized protein n=1 Tax=Aneurinibacillus soli TaxID=1500254 RepID=A0A0U4NLU6_9BACL|nr:hypothetical protein DFP93_10611 [Aneurinibacillus soli]BAU29636.1 hypothetical protein CB4_03873 [Aneurinibacillus soli]